ncbi:DUF2993 domain-containing protein [Agromyces sp. MMS24-K17]|uniref:LmeA family phospholipid-binding protein n=1 Tax=Agromyces sp. MMS24-K17 TaxID=3372850 RepID=UPI0037549811
MTDTTEVIDTGADAPEPPRRRGRGWIVAGVVVAVLVALVVVADVVVRNVVEQVAADQVEQRLPDGVEGDVTVRIGGWSVLAQAIGGTASEVRVEAPDLTVDGVPVPAEIVATDVPVRLDGPIGHVDATIELSEDALNALVHRSDIVGGFTLGDGTVGYDDTIDLLGFSIPYSATAEPEAAGTMVLLTPVAVEVGGQGGRGIDITRLVSDAVLGGEPLRVCAAEHLPPGVEVSGIAVSTGEAVVRLSADDVMPDAEHLAGHGSC